LVSHIHILVFLGKNFSMVTFNSRYETRVERRKETARLTGFEIRTGIHEENE